MKPVPSHRGRFALGLFLALAAGAWLLTWILDESRSAQRLMESSRTGIVLAQSLAEVVHEALKAGVEVQPVVAGITKRNDRIRSIRVIQGTRLEASTDPRDTGDKAAPRRLVREEKDVYDKGQRLRAAVLTNQEEGGARKEEIEILELPSGALSLAAPIEQDGAVIGYVEMEMEPFPAAPRSGWIKPVALILIPVAVFLLIGLALGEKRIPLALVALLLLIGSLGWYAMQVVRTLQADRRAQETAVAALMREQVDRAQQAFQSLGVALAAPPDASTWDVDVFRNPRSLVTADGKIDESRLSQDVQMRAQELRKMAYGVFALSLILLAVFGLGGASHLWATLLRYREAYAYTTPAMIGMVVLVFFPFFYGIALSFTDSSLYNSDKPILEVWSGIKNYVDILGDFSIVRRTEGGLVVNYQNFYWTLLFTVIWTVSNVTIGVTLGLILALILNTKGLAFRPIYRVLLIFPWAMPNYITALIWKGMFHQQFGVINQILQVFGADPLSWFQRPATSFLTALATNGWLSFPFMMVVSLGALQSISADLYEAARVDGASRWQQFKSITLPSLRPALVPAVILSVVWTFNMFNIIYLVTAGEPGGATEILITQAYKIAFEKYRYGYAAAYSTVIFIILLMYGTFQNRVTKATEAIS